jgi:inosine/xanthosine triphosphate pyrophosphatase family protein
MPAVLLLVLVSSFFGWPLLEGGHIAFYISQSLLVAFLLWREAARGSFAMRAVCLFGVAIEVVESRAEDPAEIALEKAEQAFLLGHKPVIVEDSGFFIHALGNFPQTHVKFSLKTLGIERILKMLVDESDRSCSWRRSVA